MATKSDDSVWVWIFLAALGVWFAYNKWWKEEDTPKAPTPIMADRPIGPFYVTTTKTGSKIYITSESVRGDRKHRQGWVVNDHKADKEFQQRATHELHMVDCETTAYRIASFVTYKANGDTDITWTESAESPAKTMYPIPDTIGGSIIDSLCSARFDTLRASPKT